MIKKKSDPYEKRKGIAKKIVGNGQDKGQVISLAVRRQNRDQ